MRQKLQHNSNNNEANKVVKYDHPVTFSISLLIIFVFSVIQISAQDGKQSKKEEKSISNKINSPTATGDVIDFKDESNNSLIKIIDEGSGGSIELLNVGTTISGNKLYNNGGSLFWGNTAIGSGGASDINSLSDAKYDGSSLFLGQFAGNADDGSNANTAIGKSALNQNTTGTANVGVGWETLNSNNTGFDNTAIGHVAMRSNTTGDHNIAIGTNVLYSNISGNDNTAVGVGALQNSKAGRNGVAIGYSSQMNTNGSATPFINSNTSVGYESLKGNHSFLNNTGNSNTAIGYQTIYSNTTGNYNTANGFQALFSNTTGNYNTANGSSTLNSNTTGNNNTATGAGALFSNTTGHYNSANGYSALYTNETGLANTANGYNALLLNVDGDYNTANGSEALYSNATGNANTANGSSALNQNTLGSNNIGSGSLSLYNNSIGNNNVGIGVSANYYNQTGSNNTIIGFEAGKGSSIHNKSGNVFIGYQAGYNETNDNRLYIENSNSDSPLIWGNFNTDRVVINGNGTHGNQNYEFFVNGDAGGTQSWNNLSDERLKKNISTIANALEKVKNLRGVNYEWKDSEKYSKDLQMGFIAQEANEVIPEVVDDSGEYYSMQYAPITALLVEAIKELEKNNYELKIKNEELVRQIAAIKTKDSENCLKEKEFEARMQKIESLLTVQKFTQISK